MHLTSSAFEPGAPMPAQFTCDGRGTSPPLSLSEIPEGTVSLALIVDDPDAGGGTWDHWVAYDIPITDDIGAGVAELGTPGRNSWGRTGYGGPCPPHGWHRYVFTVFALDARLGLPPGADKAGLLRSLAGHVLAEAQLTARYARSSR
jgi:Raf kinase inhibitor-like YbhB/YbcL family protein